MREVRGKLEKHKYNVAIACEFRKCFEQCILLAFDQFHLETIVLVNEETITNPTCDQPAEFLVTDIIPHVDGIFERRISLLKNGNEVELSQQLEQLVNVISTGHIAELCVQMTQTYRVNKNWNSHGAKVGAAICDAASLIAMIEKCNYPLIESDANCKIDANFRQTIPRGRVLTGQMFGSEDNVYMEYMIAPYNGKEERSPMTYTNLFLHNKVYDRFKDVYRNAGSCAAERAACIAETHVYRPGMPKSRPTRAHTFDFMCTYQGVHLIDGECKDECSVQDEEVLLTSAMSQFGHSNSALAMMTTSTSMTVYKLIKQHPSNRPRIYKRTLESYKMGCPRSDNYFPEEELAVPPGCETSLTARESYIDEGVWKRKPIEQRSLITTILNVVDILVNELICVDLDYVKMQKGLSYRNGFREPSFRNVDKEENKAKRVINEADRAKFILKPDFFGEKTEEDEEIRRQIVTEEDEQVDRAFRSVLSQSRPHLPQGVSGRGDAPQHDDSGVANATNYSFLEHTGK